MKRSGIILRGGWSMLRFTLRWLRRIATVLSLLLFLATLAAWGSGYWWGQMFDVERESLDSQEWRVTTWFVYWGDGELAAGRSIYFADGGSARRAGHPKGSGLRRSYYRQEPKGLGPLWTRWIGTLRNEGASTGLWKHAGIVAVWFRLPNPQGSFHSGAVVPSAWEVHGLAFPCWLAAVVFSLLPSQRTYALIRGRRKRRLETKGLCPQCSYDLRATPDPHGPRLPRCPECGRKTTST